MSETMIELPARTLPLLGEADLVIAGGGSAGVAAAVAAAQEGASVIMIEKANCAGGMLTNGLLPSIIYLSDGKNLLSGGLCWQLVQRIAAEMGSEPGPHWFDIHPEAVKLVLDDMLTESRARFLFNTYVCDVLKNGDCIEGLVINTPEGSGIIRGKFYVDATGDGNLSAMAKVPFELGDKNGDVMAPTLCCLWSGVDYAPDNYFGLGRTEWHKMEEAGTIPIDEHHFVGFFGCGGHQGCGNLGHAYGCRPLEADSYTQACVDGRKLVRRYLKFFRENVPGFEHAELAATASMLGVRESRRVTGEYVLTGDDYRARRHFADEIGCFAYPIDIHASSTDAEAQAAVEKNINLTHYQKGENYGIPYRTLLAKGTANLLLAGRAVSTDREMQSSLRVVPGCMILGEAAGVAAALAAKSKCALREVDLPRLQSTLRSRGIWLPENQQ